MWRCSAVCLVHLVAKGGCDEDMDTGMHDWLCRGSRGCPQYAPTFGRAMSRDRRRGGGRSGPLLRLFVATERALTFYSQGINQSSSGTDKVNAIINCHLATGRIGRPGMGPFSLTGQPNAMGGREVGGLANQLAAHMSFNDSRDVDRVRRFWSAPRMATRPGFKAIELFDAVLDGTVKALWILNTNPAVSMPRAGRVRAALGACPFVVVSDCWPTDTTCFADIVLPAAAGARRTAPSPIRNAAFRGSAHFVRRLAKRGPTGG